MKAKRFPENRALVPPRWLVVIFTLAGIYGMNLVYQGVMNGAWKSGIIGAVFLAVTVYVCGSALAASIWSHSVKRTVRTTNINGGK